MLRNVFAIGLLSGILVFVSGCGGGAGDAPETVAAKGTITVDGKPMGKLSVAFIPTQGKLAMGETDDQGNFVLGTNNPGDGAPPGTYTVSVNVIQEVTEAMPGMDGYKKPEAPPFNKKFLDPKTSELTATVDKDASKNDFKFDLTK